MVGALPRSAIVFSSGSERGFVERLNGFAIRRLEGQVHAGDVPVGLVYVQFISVEEPGSLVQYLGQGDGLEHGTVEPLARLQIRDAQVDVVNKPAPVQLHSVSPWLIPSR